MLQVIEMESVKGWARAHMHAEVKAKIKDWGEWGQRVRLLPRGPEGDRGHRRGRRVNAIG